MALSDNYRFKIKLPNSPEKIINPVNSELTIKWEQDKDFRFYRWELQDELIIVNEPDRDVYTFNELLNLELGNDQCSEVPLLIERKCKGEDTWSEFWTGSIYRVDIKYNLDDCEARVKPRIKDKYSCILNSWEQETDIFQRYAFANRITAGAQIGQYEFRTCYYEGSTPIGLIDDCVSGEYGWRAYEHLEEIDVDDNYKVIAQTEWVREYVEGGPEPPGGGWQLIGTRWVRPPVMIYQGISGGVYTQERKYKLIDYEIDNGVLLKEVLEGFAASCLFDNFDIENPKFVSNFFGIAPDGTQPDNPAYTAALEHLQSLVMWHITDIAKIDSDVNAQKALLTFKQLLLDLKAFFNVDWYIDSDGVLRLEHWSYFRKSLRVDLTQEGWAKYLKGRAKYSHDKDKLPMKETFEFPEKSRTFFDGAPIEYDVNCSQPDKTNKIRAELFMTDFEYVTQNEEKFEESPLFFLAALVEYQGKYALQNAANPLDSTPRVNGHLSWPNLLYNFHRHGRPQPRGLMNFTWESFLSWQFMKKQEEISVPFGCCDIGTFEPNDLVKANFGWCELEQAEYTLRAQVMKMQLRF